MNNPKKRTTDDMLRIGLPIGLGIGVGQALGDAFGGTLGFFICVAGSALVAGLTASIVQRFRKSNE